MRELSIHLLQFHGRVELVVGKIHCSVQEIVIVNAGNIPLVLVTDHAMFARVDLMVNEDVYGVVHDLLFEI